MTVQINATGLKKIRSALDQVPASLIKVRDEAVVDMILDADRFAKEQARDKTTKPVPRTRRYLNSLHPVIMGRRGQSDFEAGEASNVRYAPGLEFGTKPHVIKPRKKKALFWPGAAHPVKIVHHPGNPGYFVITNAVNKVADNATSYVNRAMNRRFKK